MEKQKVEEMNSVIKMKNEQLRQVLDEYDSIQHQLDIEVKRLLLESWIYVEDFTITLEFFTFTFLLDQMFPFAVIA